MPTPMPNVESYRENDNFYFAEVGCHKCDALLGGVSGDTPEDFILELVAIQEEKALCKQCEQAS
tara:strand:- start:1136 stop:1327 length:192 start_codon:yes stop_codon:yes gene_type:complete